MEKKIRLFFREKEAYEADDFLDIFAFEYNAQRMGPAPTINATVNSFNELDITTNSWCQFVKSNGSLEQEKFYVRCDPTTTKSNTDARYKYDIIFTSERDILDNVYFIDASMSSHDADLIVSKGSEFVFGGNLVSYVNRINASLSLSQLKDRFTVVISPTILSDSRASEDKVFSLSRATYTEGLQEIYNQFDVPYYFQGNTIVVADYDESTALPAVRYGSSDALIKVSKNSANNKIVTRCTGVGSSVNLPLYYPNENSTGNHDIIGYSGGLSASDIKKIDYNKIARLTNLRDGATMTFYKKSEVADNIGTYTIEYPYISSTSVGGSRDSGRTYGYTQSTSGRTGSSDRSSSRTSTGSTSRTSQSGDSSTSTRRTGYPDQNAGKISGRSATNLQVRLTPIREGSATSFSCTILMKFYADASTAVHFKGDVEFEGYIPSSTTSGAVAMSNCILSSVKVNGTIHGAASEFDFTPETTGEQTIAFTYSISTATAAPAEHARCSISFEVDTPIVTEDYVKFDDSEEHYTYDECGVVFNEGVEIANGASITISEATGWLQPQPNLMPSIYRATGGMERFYNATNGGYYYPDDATQTYFVDMEDRNFVNEFNSSRFSEHIETFDDIKPTIEGSIHPTTHLRMDMFTEFAYDDSDDDSVGEDGKEFKHPYFYGKLRKLDFNLFDQALEEGEMTFSFTSGQCIACNFTLLVDEDSKENTLQVTEDGASIIKHTSGDKIGHAVFDKTKTQARQNNTKDYEVWVALKKDNETFDELFPNNTYKPVGAGDGNDGDTFVITNIRMPQSYIINAEKKLEERILTFMLENNLAGYTFNIQFSRIFLEQSKNIFTDHLNESSRITLEYMNTAYLLFVNGYKYKVTEKDALPEISVTISDSLQIAKGGLSMLVSNVKEDVLAAVHNMDLYPTIARYALMRGRDDSTTHSLTMTGLTVEGEADIYDRLLVGGDAFIDGQLSIGQETRMHRGLTIGNYNSTLGSIVGANITTDGDASFRAMRANFLEVMSVIYNQIQASAAYTVFDDTGTISYVEVENKNAENKTDKVFILTFNENELPTKDANGIGIQQFCLDDILHGYVNKLHNLEYSQYGECWMYVTEIPTSDNDLGPNQVRAKLFSDDVCATPNLEPTAYMTLVHQGNTSNTERQSTFYVSSQDGNIVQLLGVNSPTMYDIEKSGYSNYGVVMGKLPPALLEYINKTHSFVTKDDPVLYAKYLAVENFLQIDYAGQPIKTERFRGEWNQEVANSSNPYRSLNAKDVTYYDTVVYDGSKWQCNIDKDANPPSEKDRNWVIVVRRGDDGETIAPFSVDLSNQFDSVGTDKDGNADSPYTIETVVSLFKGTEKVEIKELAATKPHDNISVVVEQVDGKFTGKIIYSVAQGVFVGERNHSKITVKYDGMDDKELTFTIAGVRAGDNGESAVLYRLIPSTSELAQDEHGHNMPENLTFDVVKMTGGVVASITDEEKNKLKVIYYIDDIYGGNKKFSDINIITNDSDNKLNRGVDATLYYDGSIVDSESILVVKDGKNGQNGKDGLSPNPNLIKNSNFDMVIEGEPIESSMFSSKYGDNWITFTRRANGSHYALMKYFNNTWNARYEPISSITDGIYWCFIGNENSFKIYNKATGKESALKADNYSGALCSMVNSDSAITWELLRNSNGSISIVPTQNNSIGINSYSGLSNGGELRLYSAPNDGGSQWNVKDIVTRRSTILPYWSNNSGEIEPSALNGFNAHTLAASNNGFNLVQAIEGLAPNQKYTLSFLYKTPNANANSFGFISKYKFDEDKVSTESGSLVGLLYGQRTVYFNGTNGEWKKGDVTFWHNGDDEISTEFLFYTSVDGSQISQIKLEAGEEATPYRKAESDFSAPLNSIVFKRGSTKPSTPTGGSYSAPVPADWSDGIPELTDNSSSAVYSSSCTFYIGGYSTGWTEPQLMVDSGDFDVAYCLKESYTLAPPTEHPNGFNNDWQNAPSEDAIWMATSKYTAGGSWSPWTITRVKGEKGEGINGVTTKYAITDDFVQPTVNSAEWKSKEEVGDPKVGQYFWTKVVTDYTDDSIEDTVVITVSRAGVDGTHITVTDVDYAVNTSATEAPTEGWNDTPSALKEDEYLWTRTTFSDGKVMYTVSRNGESLKISSILYAETTEENADPTKLAYFATVPTPEQGKYIWTKTTYSDGKIDYGIAYVPFDGEDAIYADLSNEMDSFALTSNGVVDGGVELTTTASMWKGATQLDITSIKVAGTTLTSNSVAIGSWAKVTRSISNKDIVVKCEVINGATDAPEHYALPIEVTSDEGTKKLTFTLTGVKGGANGEPAKLYKLSFSTDTVSKYKNGTYSHSTVNISAKLFEGGTEKTVNASDVKFEYYIDGSSTATTKTSVVNFNLATSSFRNLVVKLYAKDSSGDFKLYDTETISVIEDGKDGNNGEDGSSPALNLLNNTAFQYDEEGDIEFWEIHNDINVVSDGEYNYLESRYTGTGQVNTYVNAARQRVTNTLINNKWYVLSVYCSKTTSSIGSASVSFGNSVYRELYLNGTKVIKGDNGSVTLANGYNEIVFQYGYDFGVDQDEYISFTLPYGTDKVFSIKQPKVEAITVDSPSLAKATAWMPSILDMSGGDGNSPQENLVLNSNFDMYESNEFDFTTVSSSFDNIMSRTYGECWVRLKRYSKPEHYLYINSTENDAIPYYGPNPTSIDASLWCFVGTTSSFKIYNKYAGPSKAFRVERDGPDYPWWFAEVCDASDAGSWKFGSTANGAIAICSTGGGDTYINSYAGHENGGLSALYSLDDGSRWKVDVLVYRGLKFWEREDGYVVENSYDGFNSYALTATTGHTGISQITPNLELNTWYTLSFRFRSFNVSSAILDVILEHAFDDSDVVTSSEESPIFGEQTTEFGFGALDSVWKTASVSFKLTSSPTKFYYTLCCTMSGGGAVYITHPKLERGKKATPYRKAETDLAGPAGETGPMLVPQGTWDAGVTYKSSITTKPFVYYEGSYYVLEVAESTGQNPADNIGSIWKKMDEIEYLFTKFLLANQARFGSNDGGVFYDNLLFSAKMKNGGYYAGGSVERNGEDESKVPMLAIDFREGKLYAEDANIRGHINSTSGEFNGDVVIKYGGALRIDGGAASLYGNGQINIGRNFIQFDPKTNQGVLGDSVRWINGSLMSQGDIIPLWADLSVLINKADYFTYAGSLQGSQSGNSGTKLSMRGNVGTHLLLSENDSVFIILHGMSTFSGQLPEGFVLASYPNVIVRYATTKSSPGKPHRFLSTEGNPIYTRSMGVHGYEYTKLEPNTIVEVKPNRDAEIWRPYYGKVNNFIWAIDKNDFLIYSA